MPDIAPPSLLGHVAALWRYPVKSMRGESLPEAAFDLTGMTGDRRFAFVSSAAPLGKPRLRAAERAAMLRFQPTLEPVPSVRTPGGDFLPLDSPALAARLEAQSHAGLGSSPAAPLTLEHSPARPLTDVRPVSFISQATLDLLARDLPGFDPQRLRSNLILDLGGPAFAEENLAGSLIRLGEGEDAPILRVLERVPRCRMVSLHPLTAEPDPGILPYLARTRAGRVAMYASVARPGSTCLGAPLYLVP